MCRHKISRNVRNVNNLGLNNSNEIKGEKASKGNHRKGVKASKMSPKLRTISPRTSI